MSVPNQQLRMLSSQEWEELQRAMGQFEAAWQRGERPKLDSCLSCSPGHRRMWLLELVRLELEFRIEGGESARVENYLACYPELRADTEALLMLLSWEFHLRRQTESDLQMDEYRQRFPGVANALGERLSAKTVEASKRKTGPEGPSDDTCPLLPVVTGLESLEEVGRGGMGVVYRARDTHLNRTVAVKVLNSRVQRGGNLSRLRLEAQALAKMSHPHIVQVYGWQESGDVPVLIMEFVADGTLEDRLCGDPLSTNESARLVSILARAVAAAHAAGVVHRDLKPSNVLMAPAVPGNSGSVCGGFPKVSDFGLARLVDREQQNTVALELGRLSGDQHHTATGMGLGTPAYMSPEQAAGRNKEIGPPADVWALGVLLYRCLTGRLPFIGDNWVETLEQVKSMRYRKPRELRPELPVELEAVCLACLEKAAENRPTAIGLAERLERWLERKPVKQPEVGTAPPLRHRRRLLPWLMVAGVLLIGCAVVVWSRFGGNGTSERSERDGNAKEVVPARLVLTLDVSGYERLREGEDIPRGYLGEEAKFMRVGQTVRVSAKLSEPGYCYLLELNFDGKVDLLWPWDLGTDTGREDVQPEPTSSIQHPPDRPGGRGKASTPRSIQLTGNVEGGLQGYLLVASRLPLPPFADWKIKHGPVPWSQRKAGVGVWRSDGSGLDLVKPGEGRVRTTLVDAVGLPPLTAVCRWAGKDVVTEAIAFPVKKEDE